MNKTWLTITLGLAILAQAGCNPPPPSDGRTRIGAILFQEDQYFRLVEFGMRDAADELNVQLLLNNSFGSLDKEIALIDTYVAGQVEALVVAPLSAQSSITALRRAHQRGIPVITYDAYLDADFPVASIRSDQVDLGRKSGEVARKFITDQLGGQAKVGMVEYMALAPETAGQRVSGFRDEITSLAGVEIVTEQDAWLAPEATILVENMLTANPEINVIWAANEGGTVGAVTAVVNKGRAGEVFVFGTDMSEQIGGFLKSSDNVLQAVTGQEPFDIGSQAIRAAMAALAGEEVTKNVTLPGKLFSRENPDDIKRYLEFLKSVTQSSP